MMLFSILYMTKRSPIRLMNMTMNAWLPDYRNFRKIYGLTFLDNQFIDKIIRRNITKAIVIKNQSRSPESMSSTLTIAKLMFIVLLSVFSTMGEIKIWVVKINIQ